MKGSIPVSFPWCLWTLWKSLWLSSSFILNLATIIFLHVNTPSFSIFSHNFILRKSAGLKSTMFILVGSLLAPLPICRVDAQHLLPRSLAIQYLTIIILLSVNWFLFPLFIVSWFKYLCNLKEYFVLLHVLAILSISAYLSIDEVYFRERNLLFLLVIVQVAWVFGVLVYYLAEMWKS